MRRLGIRAAASVAMVLVSAGIVLMAVPNEAGAGVCRQEYCAKRAPIYSKCNGVLCLSRTTRKGDCLLTGVRLVRC
jgi:hypothetical protein